MWPSTGHYLPTIPGISYHWKSKFCTWGKNSSNAVALKAPRSGNVSNNPYFSLSKRISEQSSCLMERRKLVSSHSSALLLFLIISYKCWTCSCHGFLFFWFQRKKPGLLIRMENQREKKKNILIAKGILSNQVLKTLYFRLYLYCTCCSLGRENCIHCMGPGGHDSSCGTEINGTKYPSICRVSQKGFIAFTWSCLFLCYQEHPDKPV